MEDGWEAVFYFGGGSAVGDVDEEEGEDYQGSNGEVDVETYDEKTC